MRRLIARRCVYGIDLNELSVELARLAVWIHTFVPGLPLSFLDHNLVHGNALVGIGSLTEIKEKFEERTGTLFGDPALLLEAAKKPLQRLASINDATVADVIAARTAAEEVNAAVKDTKGLCDLIVALPISEDKKITGFPFENWKSRIGNKEIRAAIDTTLDGTHVRHFPIMFPEVFLRSRPGFDVILGNPPWDEVTVEELAFWARHFPGLRGLAQTDQEREKDRLRTERQDLVVTYEAEREEKEQTRKVLISGAYPDMGTGDPDLYKAFCWRFWHLTTPERGRIGVVLPRATLVAKGSTRFRETIFRGATHVDLTVLHNNGRWVFSEIDPRIAIVLVCITRGARARRTIHLQGPFASEKAFRDGTQKSKGHVFSWEEVSAWNDTASLPLLPDSESAAVFTQLRKAARLDSKPPPPHRNWRARPDRELDATLQKELMTFHQPAGDGEPDLTQNSMLQIRKK